MADFLYDGSYFSHGCVIVLFDFSGYGDRPIFLYEQGICSGFTYVIWNLAASHKHWIISGYVFVSEKSHWIGNPGKYDDNRLCGGFFGSIWNEMEIFQTPMSIGSRLIILAGALAVFVLTAAVYMTAQLGTAPYDAIPFIIVQKTKKLSFRWVRMLWDTTAVVIGMLLGMKLGVITVLMVLTLGPVVSWFGDHVAGNLFERD